MTSYDFEDAPRTASSEHTRWRRRTAATLRWLGRRPGESWAFFAVGLVIGGLFL